MAVMAEARVLREVILRPDRTLRGVSSCLYSKRRQCVLGFELVGEDEVCVFDDLFICGDDVVVDIETALITHDGVKN